MLYSPNYLKSRFLKTNVKGRVLVRLPKISHHHPDTICWFISLIAIKFNTNVSVAEFVNDTSAPSFLQVSLIAVHQVK